MKRLYEIQKIVFDVLMDKPETRNSDNLLYLEVLATIDDRLPRMAFKTIMYNVNEYGLPSYESVGRTRRKIQADYPELKAIDKIDAFRKLKEEKYKEYARG